MRIRSYLTVIALGVGVLLWTTSPAQAGQGGQGGTVGNALNPRAISSVATQDPDGLGIAEHSRTPTGLLIPDPPRIKQPSKTASGLLYRATVEFGAIGLSGESTRAKFKEYKDLESGAYLNTFTVNLEKPERAFHVDALGGGLGREDQYLALDMGRYNAWRVRGAYSEVPHVFTTTYHSLWDGLGTDNLTLRGGLRPGGVTDANTTQANVLQVLTSTPESDLGIVRSKSSVRFDLTLPDNWNAFASYAHEHRAGSRPFGAVFGGGGGGGNMEVPESIDSNTQDVLAGLQFANALTNVNLQVAASLFQNDIDTLTFENPLFITTNTIVGVPATTFTQGRFDMHPNNQYYNVKGEFARKFPGFLKSRVTGVASLGRMQQNDQLIPSAIDALAGGTINGVSTAGAWNTTASLSKPSAEARIDTTLVDLGIVLNPAAALELRGKFRYYDTDNSTEYLACNPLTGQWGRLLNDGSGGNFVTPNLTAGNNPAGTLATGYNGAGCNQTATRALNLAPSAGNGIIRNFPYEYGRQNAVVSADYRVNRDNSLEAAVERETIRRKHREREETWEDKVRVGYVNRGFDAGTLRLSYEYGRRRGSEYVPDPYEEFFSASLGPVPTAATTNMTSWVHNVEQFRKFDVADHNQQVFNLRFNHDLGSTVDASVSLQVRDVKYPTSEYGRDEHQKLTSPSAELNWQPTPATSAYGFYSYQAGAQHQTNSPQSGCTIGNFSYFFSDGSVQTNATGVAPAAPAGTTLTSTQQVLASNWQALCETASATSPLYPFSRSYQISMQDRNHVVGLGFHHELGTTTVDLGYTYSRGRTRIRYAYNAAALGLTPRQVELAGDGWRDLILGQHIVEANAVLPLRKRLSLRLLYRYEQEEIDDWHYRGIDLNPSPSNNSVYLDFGPQDYKVHLFGAFFRLEL